MSAFHLTEPSHYSLFFNTLPSPKFISFHYLQLLRSVALHNYVGNSQNARQKYFLSFFLSPLLYFLFICSNFLLVLFLASFVVCLDMYFFLLSLAYPHIIRLTRRESVVGVSQTAKNKLIKRHMKNYVGKRELNGRNEKEGKKHVIFT